MIKFTTGTELRLKYGKIAKNTENHIKLVIKSKKQVKNHVILYYNSVSTCQITHMRTVAVRPPILCKKKLNYVNGGTQEKKFNIPVFLHHINA